MDIRKYTRRNAPIKERFSCRYDLSATGCWIWNACLDHKGYGKIRVNGKGLFAHRVSYEIHIGNIPDGLFVCHKCDTPACVNPNHLFLGTQKDNMQDMSSKGRSGIRVGEKNFNNKLSADDVINIRSSDGTLESIAKKFGVNFSTIHSIKTRRTWKHIP